MTQIRKGDWVKWGGDYYPGLCGIVVETRTSLHDSPHAFHDRPQAKVIWDGKGFGINQKSEGSWQRGSCLKILSSVEQNDENE